MKKLLRVVVWTALLFFLSFVYTGSNQVSAKDFKDVPKKHPNYVAIQEMQSKGFISGYPDGKFRPNENISRKHVAVLLDKALNFPTPPTEKLIFKDVPKSHLYYSPIMKLSNEGIVSGGANGRFNPDSPITRIQMAKILDLAFEFNLTDSVRFSDINMVHWGYVHASALYANGVTKGDQGKFLPNKPVTRAHYAEFLHRAMKVVKTPSGDKVSKDKVIDLTNRLPLIIEGIRIQGKKDNKIYSQMSTKQLPYATSSFINGLLKDDYPAVSAFGDAFLFPQLNVEPTIRFEYNQPDKNTLVVQTIELADMLSGGSFINYIFKKENSVWKMDNYKYKMIGQKNFELTITEAEAILKYGYSSSKPSFLNITYLSKSTAIAEEYKTNIKYTYDQYEFLIETNRGREKVEINSNDGFYLN